MVKKCIKFIEKSPHKDRFLTILEHIAKITLDGYDIKKPQGWQNIYRIRVGDVRFIFKKTPSGNKIIRVTNRGDAY